MPRTRGFHGVGTTVGGNYEALKSAVEFEALAARTADPHVKATYLKLAMRYRALIAVDPRAREEAPPAISSQPSKPAQ